VGLSPRSLNQRRGRWRTAFISEGYVSFSTWKHSVHLAASAIARLYRDGDGVVPFRALRRVFRQGLATVQDVTTRVRTGSGPQVGEDLARRLLPLLPSFRWLDETSGWFSLRGGGGQLSAAIRKIFSVARRVSLDDLGLAIGKRTRAFRSAPRQAVRHYLTEIVGCRAENDWLLPGAGLVPKVLTKSDRSMLDLLSDLGDVARLDQLKRAAGAAHITPAALRRFLRVSPLVVSEGSQVRVIGAAAPTVSAASSRARVRPIAV
jgi:hypothetical protein